MSTAVIVAVVVATAVAHATVVVAVVVSAAVAYANVGVSMLSGWLPTPTHEITVRTLRP